MRNTLFASAILLALPAVAAEVPASTRYFVNIDFTASKTVPEARSSEVRGTRQTRRMTTSIASVFDQTALFSLAHQRYFAWK